MRPILTAQTICLAKSAISSASGQFISLLAPLLVMPAMLASLGDEAFGIWAATVAVTSVMAFMDLGIGSGLLSKISDASGRNDDRSVRRYIASGYAILGSIGAIGLCAVLILSLTGIGGYYVSPVMWPIVVAVLTVFFTGIPAVIIYRILHSLLLIPLQSALQASGAVCSILACLAAIYFGAPPWFIVVAYGGFPILVMIFASIWFFVRYERYRPRRDDFTAVDTRQLVGLGSDFFFLSILTAVGINADVVIIGHIAGPVEVAGFVPPMRLGSVMVLLVTQFFMPLWSFNAQALARGEVEWVRRMTLLMSLSGFIVVAACGMVIVGLSDDIMMLWMHRTFPNQDAVLWAMTAASAVIAFTSPYNMVLNAKGCAREQVLPWLAFAVVTIALKLWLVSAETTWIAPAITCVCYLVFITPIMIIQARRIMSAPVASSLLDSKQNFSSLAHRKASSGADYGQDNRVKGETVLKPPEF